MPVLRQRALRAPPVGLRRHRHGRQAGQHAELLARRKHAARWRRLRLRASFGDEKFPRLVELKAKYDPDNVFALNHNIPAAVPV